MTVLAGGLLLAGCGRMNTLAFDTRLDLGSVSLADRCGDFMHRAFPGGGLTISGSHVVPTMDRTTVTLQAVRENVPAGGLYARNVGVECRFENGILTGFRWTAGPARAADGAPAP